MSRRHHPVEHPSHYTRGGIESLDVIEAWGLGFHLGNALKYIARAGHKRGADPVEDLRKARFYIDRQIARLVAKSARRPRTKKSARRSKSS